VTWLAAAAGGWAAGVVLAWLFVAGASRPTPAPVVRLDNLRDLADAA
jgi:hypothetical protein